MSKTTMRFEPSIVGLPGTEVDEHGNVYLTDTNWDGCRHKYEHLMQLDLEGLCNRPLYDLLNWMRWGGHTEVMWECTLPELIAFIERWEQINKAPRLYQSSPRDKPIDWESLWDQYGSADGRITRRVCVECGEQVSLAKFCGKCDDYVDTKAVEEGPRGTGSYNLVLEWNDGHAVAAAAYLTRDKERHIPKHLR